MFIRSDNVLPAILEWLKKERTLDKTVIEERSRQVATAEGLMYRTQAVGFSLTALKRFGWATNERRGIWTITPDGLTARITAHDVTVLGRTMYPSRPGRGRGKP